MFVSICLYGSFSLSATSSLDEASAACVFSLANVRRSAAVRNEATTKNFVTLLAHLALRLPRAHYFSGTDIAFTVQAAVLARAVFKHLISNCTAAELSAVLARAPNPGRTRNKELDAFSWEGFVAACIDFLSLSPVTPELLELHTQVATLLVVVLSTQLVEPDVLSASSLMTGEPSLQSSDPGLVSIGVGVGDDCAWRGVMSRLHLRRSPLLRVYRRLLFALRAQAPSALSCLPLCRPPPWWWAGSPWDRWWG